jgi:hypothetical protein
MSKMVVGREMELTAIDRFLDGLPPPTTDVPSYMGVIVTSAVTKSGSTISGNFSEVVVVITDPDYALAPGHSGTGRIVAVFCQ